MKYGCDESFESFVCGPVISFSGPRFPDSTATLPFASEKEGAVGMALPHPERVEGQDGAGMPHKGRGGVHPALGKLRGADSDGRYGPSIVVLWRR